MVSVVFHDAVVNPLAGNQQGTGLILFLSEGWSWLTSTHQTATQNQAGLSFCQDLVLRLCEGVLMSYAPMDGDVTGVVGGSAAYERQVV